MCRVFLWEPSRFLAPFPPWHRAAALSTQHDGIRTGANSLLRISEQSPPAGTRVSESALSLQGLFRCFWKGGVGVGSSVGKPRGPECSRGSACRGVDEWWKFRFCGPLCLNILHGWESLARSGEEAGQEEAEGGIFSWL